MGGDLRSDKAVEVSLSACRGREKTVREKIGLVISSKKLNAIAHKGLHTLTGPAVGNLAERRPHVCRRSLLAKAFPTAAFGGNHSISESPFANVCMPPVVVGARPFPTATGTEMGGPQGGELRSPPRMAGRAHVLEGHMGCSCARQGGRQCIRKGGQRRGISQSRKYRELMVKSLLESVSKRIPLSVAPIHPGFSSPMRLKAKAESNW